MPDLLTRTKHEDEVAILIYFYLDEAEATLRAGESVNWLNWSANLGRELTPVLAAVYLEAAEQLVGEHDGTLREPEQRAREWAARRANWLAGAMATTTQQAVAAKFDQAVRQAASSNSPISDSNALQQAVEELKDAAFSRQRAVAAGATETTEAITKGEVFAAVELARIGLPLVPFWRTEEDDRVCPICAPLDGTTKDAWPFAVGAGPPAHVSCRCVLEWRGEPLTGAR